MMTPEVWAIRADYGFEAVQVDRETAHCVFYWPSRLRKEAPRRGDKRYFLDLRGDEETVRRVRDKLVSALAEHDRRKSAAAEWFTRRKAEILKGSEA